MAGRKSSASNIKMPDVNALFGLEEDTGRLSEKVEDIAIDQLHSFDSHPFRVLDDEKMQETVESVREHGIISPLLVRPGKESGYEIISGHRRKRACELLGLKAVPCFVRGMTDEEATVTMVDSNIQREELLYSEKAYAYKIEYYPPWEPPVSRLRATRKWYFPSSEPPQHIVAAHIFDFTINLLIVILGELQMQYHQIIYKEVFLCLRRQKSEVSWNFWEKI